MKTVIVDNRIHPAAKDALFRLGFSVITLPPAAALPEPIASHTDILLCKIENDIIVSENYYAENSDIFDKLLTLSNENNIIKTKSDYKRDYPYNAILNALIIGRRIFAKCDSIAPEVTGCALSHGYEIFSVKQGYPACTVLPLGDDAAVTADRGMAAALTAVGISVTLICDSETISLKPYSYGFIGGCAGEYRGTVYFVGNLDSHPEAPQIRHAIEAAGLIAVSLMPDSDLLFDVGGLRFLD